MEKPVSPDKAVKQFFSDTPPAGVGVGNVSEDETAAFIYPNEEKQLLFDIDKIVSVSSYDGKTVYEYGRDYAVKDGKLTLTEGSAIPVMTPELYYSPGEQPLLKVRRPDGSESPCYFNESGTLGRYQIKVTYVHGTGNKFTEPGKGRYERFLQKLKSGKDVTVLFHGDSITYGANASLTHNRAPYGPSFPILFTCALARIYDYGVRFVLPEAEKAYGGPFPEEPKGKKGVITLVNTAVGGWNSQNGVNSLETHILPQIKKYGCDLFVLGYGMNDGKTPPEKTASNCEKIVRGVLSLQKNASITLISTMLPNPDGIGWFANQRVQEPELVKLSEKLNAEGTECDVAKMTSVSKKILKRKKFIDITGNNINHPNDYLSRVYAASLMLTLTGRETVTGEDTP
ncbi:MAG: SGNH/GDSL hydrolase family protein [Clostridia bacterium]|nr:SGNH/GDSL hydrolase family protein [Clostridia bacterium]